MRLIQIMAGSIFAAATWAQAQTEPATTVSTAAVAWHCWYAAERETSIACRLLAAPESTLEASSNAPMIHRIRQDPGSLHDEVVLIPIGGPPVDMARTARLARAVMCGVRADCSVDFSRPQVTR